MSRNPRAAVTVVAALAVMLVPAAEAKFRLTMTLEPTRPVAGSPTRVLARTDIFMAREHGIRLFAVGPWRARLGQAFFEIRLVRTGLHTLTGRVRFPYPGRWHLNVPPSPNAPPVDLWVRVRPRA